MLFEESCCITVNMDSWFQNCPMDFNMECGGAYDQLFSRLTALMACNQSFELAWGVPRSGPCGLRESIRFGGPGSFPFGIPGSQFQTHPRHQPIRQYFWVLNSQPYMLMLGYKYLNFLFRKCPALRLKNCLRAGPGLLSLFWPAQALVKSLGFFWVSHTPAYSTIVFILFLAFCIMIAMHFLSLHLMSNISYSRPTDINNTPVHQV